MDNLISRSPDLLHEAVLKYSGEIRFGPAYYSLTIDKISFGERVFGGSYLWSPNSRYFAAQEWETTSEERGPQTRLLLIDLETKQECVLSRAAQGFIIPKKFENDQLVYTKEYRGEGVTKEFEIEFQKLSRWENLK